jgi:hypothetical protein
MPTLTETAPDTIDLDYFYNKCSNCYGIGIYEDSPGTPRPIPPNKKPNYCTTTELRSGTKTIHYFEAPASSATVNCLCMKYHTNFVSAKQTTYQQKQIADLISNKKQLKNLANNIVESTEFVPPSPTTSKVFTMHHHPCAKCAQLIDCKLVGTQHYLADDAMLFENDTCHKTCVDNQLYAQQGSSTHRITTEYSENNNEEENTTANTNDNDNMDLDDNNNNSSSKHKQKQKQQDNPETTTDDTNQMTNLFAGIHFKPTTQEQKQQQQIAKQQQQQQRRKENLEQREKLRLQQQQQPLKEKEDQSKPMFDWVKNYPITAEMEQNKKLNTDLSKQLFYFLKKHLSNFYPGKEIKPATSQRPPLKASFHYIIHVMASQKPEFLTELIYKANPEVTPNAPIPFTYLETTFKSLLTKFTTILFTKLNYIHIFESTATIPPLVPKYRLQFCLNLARLHLHLLDKYQTINYTKFSEDLKFKPKQLNIESIVSSRDDYTKPYFTMQSDKRFNITIYFNLPTTLFLEKYNILSL